MNLSRSKRRLLDLRERVTALTEVALGRAPLFPGSVYQSKSRCGKPQCKCASTDYRHQQWCVSYVEDGASRTRVVPPELRPEVEVMTDEYRQLRKAEREVRKALESLLAEWARIREARCRAGRKRYEQLVAQPPKGPKGRPSKKGGK